jgi:hypothetical protein
MNPKELEVFSHLDTSPWCEQSVSYVVTSAVHANMVTSQIIAYIASWCGTNMPWRNIVLIIIALIEVKIKQLTIANEAKW